MATDSSSFLGVKADSWAHLLSSRPDEAAGRELKHQYLKEKIYIFWSSLQASWPTSYSHSHSLAAAGYAGCVCVCGCVGDLLLWGWDEGFRTPWDVTGTCAETESFQTNFSRSRPPFMSKNHESGWLGVFEVWECFPDLGTKLIFHSFISATLHRFQQEGTWRGSCSLPESGAWSLHAAYQNSSALILHCIALVAKLYFPALAFSIALAARLTSGLYARAAGHAALPPVCNRCMWPQVMHLLDGVLGQSRWKSTTHSPNLILLLLRCHWRVQQTNAGKSWMKLMGWHLKMQNVRCDYLTVNFQLQCICCVVRVEWSQAKM